MTPSAQLRILVIGILAAAGANAQQHDQARLLQSSTWSGTLTWTADQHEEAISIEFSESSGQLRMRTSGSREPCMAEMQAAQQLRNGTIIFVPAQPERCDAPVRTVSVSRSSETDIGLLMMSAVEGLSLGQLAMDNPSEEQIADREALRRPLPKSLDGYYRVSESGLVLKVERVESKSLPFSEYVQYRVVVADAFAEDAGVQPGDLHGRGRYLSLVATLSLSERSISLPEEAKQLSHCPPMHMPSIEYTLANTRRAERAVSSVTMLAMRPADKRYCATVSVDAKACRIVRCDAYKDIEDKKSILLEDEVVARQLALVSRAAYEPDTTYADSLADMRRRTALRKAARQRGNSGGSGKGYFDRGGACGSISCEEEDTLQFIVDQYW